MLLQKIKSQDIDAILNEIDEDEKQKISNKQKILTTNIKWKEIVNKVQNSDTSYIKNIITSKEMDINAQNPENGLTLLHYAIIIGNHDLVKVICNFGADATVKDDDGEDPLYHAIKCGRYEITEILFYRQLSGSLGNDLRNIASKIRLKTREAQNIMEYHDQIESEKRRLGKSYDCID